MLVGKIFAPKWKHRNADVRKQALLDLNPGHQASRSIIIEMAQADLDIEIRKLALKRIDDVAVIVELASSQREKLGEDINRRLGQLISRSAITKEHTVTIDAYLRQFADSKLLQLVLEKSQQESLRETALLALDKNSTYADTAMNDNSAALRLLAIERIKKVSTLERVLKHSKTRDKSVYQIAKQKLDANHKEKNKPSQRQLQSSIDQLLVELSAIVKVCQEQQRWAPQQAQISALQEDWQLLIPHTVNGAVISNTEDKQQFELLNQQFLHGIEQEKDLLKKRELEIEDFEPINDIIQEYCSKLQELNTELETITNIESLRQISSQAEQIESVWKQIHVDLPAMVDSSYMQDTLELYKSRWRTYQKYFLIAKTNLTNLAQRKQYLTELQTLVQSNKSIAGKKLVQYKNYFKYFGDGSAQDSLPEHDSIKDDRKRYTLLLQQLESKLSQQSAVDSCRLDELNKLVTDLESALKNGKAKFAVNLTRRWVKLIAELDVSTRQSKKFSTMLSHYNNLQQKVSDLREWREWSNLPIKEKLCEDIEVLANEAANAVEDSQFNYSAAMEQLRAYRRDWSKLVDTEFKSDKNLEKKFSASCDIISQASKSFFNGLSQERKINLGKRQQYCAELDVYYETINAIDISEIDFKHLEKVIRVSTKEWHSLGVVDRTKKVSINKQFSDVISRLADTRNKVRECNSEEKNNLLLRANKALGDIETDAKNISSSIETIKRLQSQWKNVGVAVKDRELWQKFQLTCNKVFEHRQLQNNEKATLRKQLLQQLQKICTDIESILIDENNSLSKTRQQFSDLKSQWTEKSDEVDDKTIERRYKLACQGFEKKLVLHQKDTSKKNDATRQILWDICVDLESLLADSLQATQPLTVFVAEFKQLRERHNLLSITSGADTKSLQTRYQKLIQHLSSVLAVDDVTELTSELQATLTDETSLAIERRKKLCLHAEILANIESPSDEMDARMSLQVSMLASRMTRGGNSGASLDEELIALLDAWHSSGIAVDPVRITLEKRFSDAVRAMVN